MITEKKDLLESTRRYYDVNSRLFGLLGADAGSKVIHQPLFFDEKQPLREAVRTQENMLLWRFLPAQGRQPLILDLGCGTGSSLFYLAGILGKAYHYHGITLSQRQFREAAALLSASPVMEQCTFHCGSYLDLPDSIPRAGLAYAIESFIHCTAPEEFFRQIANKLDSGSKLVLFDDFLQEDHVKDQQAHQILDDFSKYWMANALLSAPEVISLAGKARLKMIENSDLTHMLRLNRLRDKWVKRVLPILKLILPNWHYTSFLTGGNARQRAFEMGLLNYRLIAFEKD